MSVRQAAQLEVNAAILEMEYAVRGPIPKRAAELKLEGKRTIPCNIGNPQALGQSPITFYRQVLSLGEDPARIARERSLNTHAAGAGESIAGSIPDEVLDVADEYLSKLPPGMGAYTESNGPRFVREAVAAFIDARDGFDPTGELAANPDEIFITNGASEGVKYLIDLLISGPRDGIMIPIPQYPLYSATVTKAGGVQVSYYPDEDAGWALDRSMLEESLQAARADGVTVKGIVVINPGNPTGAILDEATIREIIDFAEDNDLVVMADEVYQENVYGAEFVSFAKVLGDRPVPLFSLHSTSKGFIGECGHRGGYLEVRNPPEARGSGLSFTEIILKQASVHLCSNTVGQLLTYLMVTGPKPGGEAHKRFLEEKDFILGELQAKATMLRKGFEEMDSVECFGRTGAMYLFPRLGKLPPGATDFDYCMSLLERTGLCTVNGSGFGQREGTHHLRVAFLPPRDLLEEVLPEWIRFHNEYVSGG